MSFWWIMLIILKIAEEKERCIFRLATLSCQNSNFSFLREREREREKKRDWYWKISLTSYICLSLSKYTLCFTRSIYTLSFLFYFFGPFPKLLLFWSIEGVLEVGIILSKKLDAANLSVAPLWTIRYFRAPEFSCHLLSSTLNIRTKRAGSNRHQKPLFRGVLGGSRWVSLVRVCNNYQFPC